MRLQFAFDKPENPFLPHNFVANTNRVHRRMTTIRRWYRDGGGRTRFTTWPAMVRTSPGMIRTAWSSVADFAIVPLQDILDLGTEAR
jgi:4-alpha-glucanotransferase